METTRKVIPTTDALTNQEWTTIKTMAKEGHIRVKREEVAAAAALPFWQDFAVAAVLASAASDDCFLLD